MGTADMPLTAALRPHWAALPSLPPTFENYTQKQK